MELTIEQLEAISDQLRIAGYELPDYWDNDDIAKLADCILIALDIEFTNGEQVFYGEQK